MKKIWFWLTYDVSILKQVIIMAVVALLVWGFSIWYTEANPDRLLKGDFERVEVWLAIVGGLAGMFTGLIFGRMGKGNDTRREIENRLKN